MNPYDLIPWAISIAICLCILVVPVMVFIGAVNVARGKM